MCPLATDTKESDQLQQLPGRRARLTVALSQPHSLLPKRHQLHLSSWCYNSIRGHLPTGPAPASGCSQDAAAGGTALRSCWAWSSGTAWGRPRLGRSRRLSRPTEGVPRKSKTEVTRNGLTELPEQAVFSREGWGNVLLGQRWGLR